MSEETKNILGKKRTGWLAYFLGGLVLGASLFVVVLLIGLLMGAKTPFFAATLFGVGSFALANLVCFIRWLCCWRNFKRFAFVVACLITLAALLIAEENWRGKRALDNFKREWEAKGERFDYASIVPPVVPDEQNFAMAPVWVESVKATLGEKNSKQWFGEKYADSDGRTNFVPWLEIRMEYMETTTPKGADWRQGQTTDLKAWQSYYRNTGQATNYTGTYPDWYPANIFTNSFPVAPQPQSPAQDVLLALSKFDPVVDKLRAASARPYARFPVFQDADHPFDTLLPHLTLLKASARLFQMRASAELQNNETGKAKADTVMAIELGEKIRNEPFLISHLVRIAIFHLALQPVYEGLAEHRWSDSDLVEFDAALARLDFLADYGNSLRGERAACMSGIDFMRRSGRVEFFDGPKMKDQTPYLPGAFFYQNELTVAQVLQEQILPMVDAKQRCVRPSEVKAHSRQINQDIKKHWLPYRIFAQMFLPAVASSVQKFAVGQGELDLARTAIALERFRLAHGNFPESLDALAPQFIVSVPHDVIGGGPLKYRREADGTFTLYSIGWNEKDDGGVVVLSKGSSPDVDLKQGDWVWRYPKK